MIFRERFSLRERLLIAAIVFALAAQITLAATTRTISPHRELLGPAPRSDILDALAFGDRQWLFRIDSLALQDAGDTGGRIVPVKNYDFAIVVAWLRALQALDVHSLIPIGLADGYFGQSQNVEDIRPIVEFMQENVALAPAERWRFLYDAISLAGHRLRDDTLALKVARQLASYDSAIVPLWAAMTPAFILERKGEFAAARAVIEKARQSYATQMSPDDDEWTAKYRDYLASRE